jgi:methyl-accepting chemotaxis protein
MNALKNLPIVQKILLPLILMGLLTLGTSLYALSQMRMVAASYQGLLDREVAATEAILRANDAVGNMGRTAYIMVAERDSFIVDSLKEEIDLKSKELTEHLSAVEGFFPEFTNDLNNSRTDFAALNEIIEKARKSILAGKVEEGARNLVDFGDPRMSQGLNKLAGLTKELDLRRQAAAAKSQSLYSRVLLITLVVGISGTALFLGIALAITFVGISRPLKRIVNVTTKLAEGDLTVSIRDSGRKDEIGAVSRAVAVFQKNMIEANRLRQEQEEMKAKAEAEKRNAMIQLADDFEMAMATVVKSVATSSIQMRRTAEALTGIAEQSNRQTIAVAHSAEQAAGNVNTVAAAAEELSASIGEISRRVAESSGIADEAVAEAERSNTTVAGLVEAASRIGDVVRLISDIASQTNLLALNATIEAARAGEAGKGFAVVASEVKSLATQTAKATEEIGSQISEIQNVARSAASAIKGVGGTIGRISEIVTTIAAAVEEQGAATQEIAQSVAQAAAGTNEVSSTIGDVTRAAAETGSMASDVLTAANDLVNESDLMRKEVENFIEKVRVG